jgi:FG-GAP-like repeat
VLAAFPDGTLRAYDGNGANGWAASAVVGSGWQAADAMLSAGDFAGNGHPAVLYRAKSDGGLWMWTTNGAGGWVGQRQVGWGWDVCSSIFSPGDFDGDGHPDVMCLRRGDGTLWLYSGDGAGGWLSGRQVGQGFAGVSKILGPGDFDGDGYNDVMAVVPDGSLVLYSGNGSGGWRSQRAVGTGWGGLPAVFAAGDLNGGGYPDVLAVSGDGRLWNYEGNFAGGWTGQVQIGTDWNLPVLVAGVG